MSLMATLLVWTATAPTALAGEAKTGQLIEFRYSTCAGQECVEISSPKAWTSLISGSFTTEGPTRFRVLDRSGKVKQTYFGSNATFNPDLDLLTLEQGGSGFLLYSQRDQKLSVYGSLAPIGADRPSGKEER